MWFTGTMHYVNFSQPDAPVWSTPCTRGAPVLCARVAIPVRHHLCARELLLGMWWCLWCWWCWCWCTLAPLTTVMSLQVASKQRRRTPSQHGSARSTSRARTGGSSVASGGDSSTGGGDRVSPRHTPRSAKRRTPHRSTPTTGGSRRPQHSTPVAHGGATKLGEADIGVVPSSSRRTPTGSVGGVSAGQSPAAGQPVSAIDAAISPVGAAPPAPPGRTCCDGTL